MPAALHHSRGQGEAEAGWRPCYGELEARHGGVESPGGGREARAEERERERTL